LPLALASWLYKLPLASAGGKGGLRKNGFSQINKKYILLALAQKPLKTGSLHKPLKLFIKALSS
jgi:hypothetical protein